MYTNLLVIGASARAFAVSASRLGVRVNAIDLFGDQDLQKVCGRVVQVHADAYPNDLPAIASAFPEGPVVYTGGLENHPKVLGELSSVRKLLGNGPKVVEQVRDFTFIRELAHKNGCSYPTTFSSPAGLPKDGTYLKKPTLSIGGKGILAWKGESKRKSLSGDLWQAFVAGVPMSLSFLASPEGVEVLGVCRQLIGCAWCQVEGFTFCGAVEIPKVELQQDMLKRLFRFAGALVERTGLMGLIGIDFIMPRGAFGDQLPKPIVLEVNPRPTATMELFERRTGRSHAGMHLFAQKFPIPAESVETGHQRDACWGKAIVFAKEPLYVSSALNHHLTKCMSLLKNQSFGWPMVADWPRNGTVIQAGHPIVTVFSSAQTPRSVVRRLRGNVNKIVRGL